MATLKLTRQQLIAFLGNDQDAIRKFENLFTGSTLILTGDIDATGTIIPSAVTLSKMANLPASSIIGNIAGVAAAPQALSGAQVTTLLNVFTSILKGLVPASGGGAVNFLRADGVFATPSGTFDPSPYALDAAVVHDTGNETVAGIKTLTSSPDAPGYDVAGTPVLGAQVAGIGATIPAYVLTGVYAVDLASLQAAYNQLLALVAALKTHGMVAT